MEEIVHMRGDDERNCQQRKRGFASWFFAILDRFFAILDRFLGILDRFLGSNEFSATSKTGKRKEIPYLSQIENTLT